MMLNLAEGTPHLVEEWRLITLPKVVGNTYEVSSLGRVRDIGKDRLRNPSDHTGGYHIVSLKSVIGIFRPFYLHRLVAWEFCSGRDETLEVNHINEDKKDNRSVNLSWVTSKENTRHSIKSGRINGRLRGKTNQLNSEIRARIFELLCRGCNFTEIGRKLNLPRGTISSVFNGKSYVKDVINEMGDVCCLSESCRCVEIRQKLIENFP